MLFEIDQEQVKIKKSVQTPEGAFVNAMMIDPDGKLNLLCKNLVYRI